MANFSREQNKTCIFLAIRSLDVKKKKNFFNVYICHLFFNEEACKCAAFFIF